MININKVKQVLECNQRFKVDKSNEKITSQLIPSEESSDAWTKGWYTKINVRELCHQLCSISFRDRNGSCYSQRHRNSLSFGELSKLFDWDVYGEEQEQIIKVSVKECSLNSDHRKKCEESSQMKIMLTPDGLSTIRRWNYYIEECMPLAQTPRLDLYFDNSALTTFALLNTACVEFLCKNNDEYCLLNYPHIIHVIANCRLL